MVNVGFVALLPESLEGKLTGPESVSINLLQAFQKVPEVQSNVLCRQGRKPMLQRIRQSVKAIWAVMSRKYDVLLFSGFAPTISLVLSLLGKVMSTKTTYIAHGLVFLERADMPRKVILERLLFTLVDCIVAISPLEQSWLINKYPHLANKIVVIPHGVSTTFEQGITYSDQDKESFLLYVGRRTRVKGLLTLVEALEQIEIPPQVVMIGPPGEDDPMLRNSESYRRGNLRILDTMTQTELKKWYTRATAFVLPSHYEPFGLVAIEAMINGCVAILSDQVGAASYLQNEVNCITYPYQDSRQLAKNIDKVFAEPENSRQIAKKGFDIAKTFTWEATAQHYVKLFSQLLEPDRAISTNTPNSQQQEVPLQNKDHESV